MPTKKELTKADLEQIALLFQKLRAIQKQFSSTYGVKDLFSNSRYYELLIANELDHILIGGFAHNKDARDSSGEYEYKHYKETSSNHTWTFNDFSDETIQNLNSTTAVIFAHIDDTKTTIPYFDWYYYVPGRAISSFLQVRTPRITNKRKMINVSPSQIEATIRIRKTNVRHRINGRYDSFIKEIFQAIAELEKIVGIKGILTSNKLWEVLLATKLGHYVLVEKQYDAIDKDDNYYEYKVSINTMWAFEDITEEVLRKFDKVKDIIVASIDKTNFQIIRAFRLDPQKTVVLLRQKLKEKAERYRSKGKEIRREQVSLNMKDLATLGAIQIIP